MEPQTTSAARKAAAFAPSGPTTAMPRNVKRWREGEMRRRWTAAGMLVAEQQFRRIIGYRDLATLVVTIERHSILVAQ
jgi:hypothetical protein